MPNTNCLAGMACPQCGADDAFYIAISSIVLMSDDGTSDWGDHTEWDDDAYCRCIECSYEATVAEFRTARGRGQLLVLAINDAEGDTALHLLESHVEAMAILRKVWTGEYMVADGGRTAVLPMPSTYKTMVEALRERWVNVEAEWKDLPAWITNAIGSEDE